MDIALLKTFLEVAATGSFVNAADRLFVTQSAVSLRVQRLEETLGKPLFTRSRAGAEMTPAGREFERYALSIIRVWEEARQQVAIPEGFDRSLTIGAQYSLWPRLGFGWIDALRQNMPDLSIRAELGMPDRLTRFLIEGVVQVGLLYMPQLRPGLEAEKVTDEDLVLVSTVPDVTLDTVGDSYVFVDWGPEFVGAHAQALPHLTNPGLTFALGAMAGEYIVNRQASAYLPARYVKRMIDGGKMHLVADAPRFPYPVWAVWRDDMDADLRQQASDLLVQVAHQVDDDSAAVLDQLRALTHGDTIEVMGATPPPAD
ncbi:LysR family transcriptional regulator [Pseudooctadecabacter jejudonensis]|uniref:HTH-type transcriptional regulator GltR n=1 Tax=Pseudooctadecabacter jejudonensis TaxID=1391910 RepID=A0A1Y5T463_9RHOB|nr:LysR family transcriptional regulator [Pseudooctadecabacter jejudonensis]SLN51945.1 HTH-type transcriptional regulator GltR [Pseudooctadecabacter jejudonensis]